jgi:OOP family OmpA-OmpF porin
MSLDTRSAPAATLAAAFFAILTFASGLAHAADGETSTAAAGWFVPDDTLAKNVYVGVQVGMDDTDYPSSNQDGSVTGVQDDDEDIGQGFFVGYQFGDYVAMQGGYRELGESDFKGQSSGGESWEAGPVRARHEADGWEFGVLGRWPLTARWYAIGYIGGYWWESKETFWEDDFVSSSSTSGSDRTYALGLEFDIGLPDRIVYRFMGAYHTVDDDETNVNSANAEMVYRFP